MAALATSAVFLALCLDRACDARRVLDFPGASAPVSALQASTERTGDAATESDRGEAVAASASSGSSVHTPEFRGRNAFKIACPVLGALYRRGILKPDAKGVITKSNLRESLQWMGNTWEGALFQGMGIAAYAEDDPEQKHRARSPRERYLNIFLMDPGQLDSSVQVQHGVSTNIRDTRFDASPMEATERLPALDPSVEPSPAAVAELADATADEAARVRAARAERLEYWFTRLEGVLEDDRLYAAGLGRLIAKLKTNGDHSSEWSKENQQIYHPGAATTPEAVEAEEEWQSTLAFTAFIAMAGRQDTEGGPLYVTLDDLKQFYLDSEFPEDWTKRDFGFMENDLGLAAEMHKESPTLAFSRLIDEDVQPGKSFLTRGVKMLTLWMANVFRKIGATDQFATVWDIFKLHTQD